MELNKTKMNLEKAAAIIGIVIGVAYSVLSILLLVLSINDFTMIDFWRTEIGGTHYAKEYCEQMVNICRSNAIAEIIMCVLTLFFGIATLITSIKLVKSPFDENGQLKDRQGLRIWMLVLSIISGDIVVIGLMIAVLCLKDYKQPKTEKPVKQVVNNLAYVAPTNAGNGYFEFYNKIQEVKRLKSLEIIDAETFKNAVAKIVKDIVEEK